MRVDRSPRVFQAALELGDSGQVETYEEELLEWELAWLRIHLPSPVCRRDEGNQTSICWFKPRAKNAIERVRSIVALLDSLGFVARMITIDDPGTVAFEDKRQLVAKPHRGRAKTNCRTMNWS